MASAPVVSDLGIPIVGDAVGSTFDNTFVFEDAWDLDAKVQDAETPDADIAWSYTVGEVTGLSGAPLSRYTLNGVEPLVDPSAAEAINPPAGNRIDSQVLGGEANPDGNTRTVTIRDRILSPIGGPNTDPGAPGIVASEVVTLFASDGSTATWATTIIFTDNDGEDRFSGSRVEVLETLSGSTVTGFTYTDFDENPSTNNPNTGGSQFQQNTNGLCLTAALTGANLPSLDSAASRFSLTDLNIMRFRLQMSTTSAAGSTPLISMTYNSPNNEFGGELIVLDNVGAANAPFNGSQGRQEYQFVIGPPGLRQAAWRDQVSGAYAPASNARTFKLVLRLLDIDGIVGGENRAGTVCWSEIELGRIHVDDLIAGETNVYTGNLVAANGTTGFELTNIGGIDQWTVAFAGGVATVTPDTTPTVGVALATFRPGNGDGSAGSPAGLPDDYPVLWNTPNQLLHLKYTLAAPTAGDAAATAVPEVIRLGADTPTQEIISNHFMSILGIGEALMPTTTATDYHAFYYTHSVTAATFQNAGRIRPLLDFADRNAGGEFGTSGGRQGRVAISSVTVGDVSANNQ